MNLRIIILLLLVSLISCIDVPEPPNDNYIVEGFVFAGERVNDISIKSIIPLSEPEGVSLPIQDADVTIYQNEEAYSLAYNESNKQYEYPDSTLEIKSQDVLRLEVKVGTRESFGSSIVPDAPTGLALSKTSMIIPEIKSAADFIGNDPLADAEIILDWDNPNNDLFYTVIEFRSILLRPILPADIQEVVDGILEDFAIITEPDTVSNYTISGALLPSYGPYVVKVYKVNQEYADLYNSVSQDSRELNKPPSNIINAHGIFATFSGDSLSFEVIKP